jgi:hypothetical protein
MSRWDEDEVLMSELGEALGRGVTVPGHRRTAAHGAFAWRRVDEELMRLAYDSLEVAPAAVRGADGPRLLSFAVGGLTIELEVGDGTVWGQAMPGGAYEVTLETTAGDRRQVVADESGIFALDGAAGPTRFTFSLGEDVRRTEWVLL